MDDCDGGDDDVATSDEGEAAEDTADEVARLYRKVAGLKAQLDTARASEQSTRDSLHEQYGKCTVQRLNEGNPSRQRICSRGRWRWIAALLFLFLLTCALF